MSNDPIAALFADAERHNIAMAEICRKADVDPTTPSRWKRNCNGANFGTVMKLRTALDGILSEQAEYKPQGAAA